MKARLVKKEESGGIGKEKKKKERERGAWDETNRCAALQLLHL